MQDHADILEDVRKDLLIQAPIGNNMEELQIQKEDFQVGMNKSKQYYIFLTFLLCILYTCMHKLLTNCAFIIQSLDSQLSQVAGVITADMEKAQQLLNSPDEDIPKQIHQDLSSTYLELQPHLTAVSQMYAERRHSLIQAMETGKVSAHFK